MLDRVLSQLLILEYCAGSYSVSVIGTGVYCAGSYPVSVIGTGVCCVGSCPVQFFVFVFFNLSHVWMSC